MKGWREKGRASFHENNNLYTKKCSNLRSLRLRKHKLNFTFWNIFFGNYLNLFLIRILFIYLLRNISPELTSASNPPLFPEEDWPWANFCAHLPLFYVGCLPQHGLTSRLPLNTYFNLTKNKNKVCKKFL